MYLIVITIRSEHLSIAKTVNDLCSVAWHTYGTFLEKNLYLQGP